MQNELAAGNPLIMYLVILTILIMVMVTEMLLVPVSLIMAMLLPIWANVRPASGAELRTKPERRLYEVNLFSDPERRYRQRGEDEVLMASGGGDDFESFVAGVQSRLQRTAWLLTGNWQEAEDLVQTSLAKAWRHWDRVATADNPEAYTRRTLMNSFLSARRRRWRAEQPDATVQPPPVGDPADLVALRTSILAALAQLSARQRAAVVLRFFDDLPEAQVADVMGCRLGTVKSTTAKALERLRVQPGLNGLVQEAQP